MKGIAGGIIKVGLRLKLSIYRYSEKMLKSFYCTFYSMGKDQIGINRGMCQRELHLWSLSIERLIYCSQGSQNICRYISLTDSGTKFF